VGQRFTACGKLQSHSVRVAPDAPSGLIGRHTFTGYGKLFFNVVVEQRFSAALTHCLLAMTAKSETSLEHQNLI